ncbi:hypothetical protein GCM10010371_01260 [Streptomyces subrutilus]|uniref:Uncharacterized protein n=1 Tax=Streptomyces subrutilus TaxID=36818 RepID=A0A5P2UE50_9ACTN|nr:hypothetical protein [Streptomyces subrutilus]QEU77258.1 hypothetical protein CP968_02185 [Streptomyces subrutilus]GGZ45959.1 hypothetical protein GCM10010371_01260 [Streptomyces subrutilus]
MPFEADLAHALDRTTDSLEPDLTALLDGAVRRGRSRRRRRTAVLAGVGACGMLAAAGLLLPGALAGTRGAGSDIETVALALPRSAITDTQMIRALEQTFPGGRFSGQTGQSNNPSDPSGGYVANGALLVEDGRGPAFVGVSALRLKLPLGDGGGLSCEQTPARAEGDTCTLSELPSSAALPGGAVVMSERNAAERPARADTAHRWTVTVTLKSTGAQLQMVQWNSTGGGTGADTPKPTRAAPPLTEQQAVAALTGAAWAPILGAVG